MNQGIPAKWRVIVGDSRHVGLPDESVQCTVTSPPYYGARMYGDQPSQIGNEPTPDGYVANIVEVMRETARIMKPNGVLFLNIGDTYPATGGDHGKSSALGKRQRGYQRRAPLSPGIVDKNMLGIPWRIAFALNGKAVIDSRKVSALCAAIDNRDFDALEVIRAGFRLYEELGTLFYIRSHIAWVKAYVKPHDMGLQHVGSCTPESVRNRPSKGWESVFVLTKMRQGYFWNQDVRTDTDGNLRDAFFIAPAHKAEGGHVAVMPPQLARLCISLGSRPGDWVYDPFGGSGTTASEAVKLGRNAIIVELDGHNAVNAMAAIGASQGKPGQTSLYDRLTGEGER